MFIEEPEPVEITYSVLAGLSEEEFDYVRDLANSGWPEPIGNRVKQL